MYSNNSTRSQIPIWISFYLNVISQGTFVKICLKNITINFLFRETTLKLLVILHIKSK